METKLYFLNCRSRINTVAMFFLIISLSFLSFQNGNCQTTITESFESTVPPSGWSSAIGGGTYNWAKNSGSTPPNGTYYAYLDCYNATAGSWATLTTTAIDLTSRGSNTPTVSFYMYRSNYRNSYVDYLEVYVNTTNSLTGATLLSTGSSTRINRPYDKAPAIAIGLANTWVQYSYNIPAGFNGMSNYIIFKAVSAYGDYVSIDQVQITSYPCIPPTIASTTPASGVGSNSYTLGATASQGTVNWYTASTGGSATATGTSFTTPIISATTTYYADATYNGCTSSSRTSIVATVASHYIAGSGIAISGTTISNTEPDQILNITQGSGISVTGTYPNYVISSVGNDLWSQNGNDIINANTGNISINNNKDILLRNSHHGLGWYGSAINKKFNTSDATENIDGPVLYGWSGGALGSKYYLTDPNVNYENIALRWSTSGDVAIGATTANAKLDVVGDIKTSVGIKFPDGLTQTKAAKNYLQGTGISITGTYPDFTIKSTLSDVWSPATNGTDIFTNTNVGIGTNNPNSLLQIKNNRPAGSFAVYGPDLLIEGPNTAYISFNTTNNQNWGTVGFPYDNDNFYLMDIYGDVVFYNGGNVGIHSLNPTDVLEVGGGGNICLSAKRLPGGSNDVNDAGDIVFKKYNSDPNTNNQLGRIWTNYSGQSGLYLSSGDNTADITIKENGAVGIGTGDQTIDDGIKLAVNGLITTTGIKIKANVFVPDYVFSPDYKITSLKEIEKYVKQNHHLPEVPSAKEFEKDGIDVANTNMLLLKKIEELTLHLIEQSKQIEKLQLENKKVNEVLSILKTK